MFKIIFIKDYSKLIIKFNFNKIKFYYFKNILKSFVNLIIININSFNNKL